MVDLRGSEIDRMTEFNGRARAHLWCLVLNLLFLLSTSLVASAATDADQITLFHAIRHNDLATAKRMIQSHPELKNRRFEVKSQDHKPSSQDEQLGFAPLDQAVWYRRQEVVQYLLGVGAELDVLAASGLGKTDYLRAHLSELKGTSRDPVLSKLVQSVPPIHWAVQGNQPDTVRWLLSQGEKIDAYDRTYETALHRACENGNLQLVQLLVENKADLNLKGGMVASSPLHFAARSGKADVVEFLLARGMDVDTQDVRLGTALHVAASLNHVETADCLIKHGANIEARIHEMWGIDNGTIEPPGSLGASPLYWCARVGNLRMVEFLVDHKANINSKDVRWTVFDVAQEYPAVQKFLKQRGAKSGMGVAKR